MSMMININKQIALLPKDIGNHILSYTNAWLDWYLENIRNKYGDKFIQMMLRSMLFRKYKTILPTTITENVDKLIEFVLNKFGITNKVGKKLTRDMIIVAFETQLSLKPFEVIN